MRLIFTVVFLFITGSSCQAEPDSSTAIQAAINEACEAQLPYTLPEGRSYLYSPLIIKTNCKIFGSGKDFSTVLQPMGVSAFIIDGANVPGGWAFRNVLSGFTIDGSTTDIPDLIYINKTYTTELINIFIFNQVSETGIRIIEANHIQLNKLVLYGESKANKFGVQIGDNASVTINDIDIENYSRCLRTSGNSTVDLNSAYMERCVVNVEHAANGIGSLNIFGGIFKASNGYNIGILGNNLNVYGAKLLSYQGVELSGKIMHCFNTEYLNTFFRSITRYDGYLQATNCPEGLI